MSDNNSENRYLHLIRHDCPLPPGTHVVGYCRDSGGEEQDRSVAQQADTIREYCAHHNLILDELYLDEARKSSNTDKRGALQDMPSGLVFCGHIEGEEHPMHIGTIPAEEGKRGEYIYFQCSLGNNSPASAARKNAPA